VRRLPTLALALLAGAYAGAAWAQPGGEATPGSAPPERAPAPPAPAKADEGDVRLRYVLEGVEVRGNQKTLTRLVLRYVPFHTGDTLDVDDKEIELTRYRLLGTGFFARVELSLKRGSRRGTAVLVVDLVERNTVVVQNLWLGIAADEDTAGNAKPQSAYLGVQAAETNLAGTGITLGAGVGVASEQIALRGRFEDPSFVGSKWLVMASVLFNDGRDFFGSRGVKVESPLIAQREITDYALVAYRRAGGSVGVGRDLTLTTSFAFEHRVEWVRATVPLVASHIRGDRREPIDFPILPGSSVLSTLRASLMYDTRDAPFLTTRGTLATSHFTVGARPFGSDYDYLRVDLSAQRWFQLPWKHVIRVSTFLGGIAGSAPFFDKYYVGDFTDLLPDRVMDLAPDRRQPPNFLGTDIIEVRYGDFAAKAEAEYRVPLYAGKTSVYAIDVFGAFGLYALATHADFTNPPSGYSGAARVPVDLTYNIGLRVDTSVGGATIAFSNLLGLLPGRNGVRK
jgi:outer membrane protein insertion porin family